MSFRAESFPSLAELNDWLEANAGARPISVAAGHIQNSVVGIFELNSKREEPGVAIGSTYQFPDMITVARGMDELDEQEEKPLSRPVKDSPPPAKRRPLGPAPPMRPPAGKPKPKPAALKRNQRKR